MGGTGCRLRAIEHRKILCVCTWLAHDKGQATQKTQRARLVSITPTPQIVGVRSIITTCFAPGARSCSLIVCAMSVRRGRVNDVDAMQVYPCSGPSAIGFCNGTAYPRCCCCAVSCTPRGRAKARAADRRELAQASAWGGGVMLVGDAPYYNGLGSLCCRGGDAAAEILNGCLVSAGRARMEAFSGDVMLGST